METRPFVFDFTLWNHLHIYNSSIYIHRIKKKIGTGIVILIQIKFLIILWIIGMIEIIIDKATHWHNLLAMFHCANAWISYLLHHVFHHFCISDLVNFIIWGLELVCFLTYARNIFYLFTVPSEWACVYHLQSIINSPHLAIFYSMLKLYKGM